MKITINGLEKEVKESVSLSALLETLGYQNAFVAVAVNATCIPKSRYQQTLVSESDEIEILAPMSGG